MLHKGREDIAEILIMCFLNRAPSVQHIFSSHKIYRYLIAHLLIFLISGCKQEVRQKQENDLGRYQNWQQSFLNLENLCTSLLKDIIVSAAHANWGCSRHLIHTHTVMCSFIYFYSYINRKQCHKICTYISRMRSELELWGVESISFQAQQKFF